MERSELIKMDKNTEYEFTAIFSQISEKFDPKSGKTFINVLIKDIKDSEGNYLTQHMWMRKFDYSGLVIGQRFQFTGMVRPYWKGVNRDIESAEIYNTNREKVAA